MSKSEHGAVVVNEGDKVSLAKIDPDSKANSSRSASTKEIAQLQAELGELQMALYAEHRRSLLVLIQAMDTGGKDGAVKALCRGLDPNGISLTNFKVPTVDELLELVLESGQPITVEVSNTNQAIGESIRPNRIATGKDVTGVGRRGVDYPWFNPSAFTPAPVCASRTNCSPDAYGFLPFAKGNSARNILDGPGLENISLSLLKNWTVGERKRVQLRYEVFNVLNHPNFKLPNRFSNDTAAGVLGGVLASGSGGPRIMQFAVRYEF